MSDITKAEYLDVQQKGYNTIPLMVKIEKLFDLAKIYEAVCKDPQQGGLLESGRAGRYSYVAFSPFAKIHSKKGIVEIESTYSQIPQTVTQGQDPLHVLEQYMSWWKAHRWETGPDWQGGALGYLSYDFARHLERLPNQTIDDLQLPDMVFTVYRDVIALDHEQEATYLITNVFSQLADSYENAIQRLFDMKQQVELITKDVEGQDLLSKAEGKLAIRPSFSKQDFEQAVVRVQEYIRAGDVFQVNLSVRQDFPISASPWMIYKTLRRLNPSPYMGYLHYPDFQAVCGSPELLIKIKNRRISTRPIAGTRPRGGNREEDLRLAKELIENEKERAEHIMLVDLERNDLGRVCKYGTVHVTDLMVIEEYSHVMHIVSHVEGDLDEGKTGYDAIRACFPGGTITGAPKIRTMEIIEELEPVQRGIYTGAIGWIDFNGDLELNIVIRTLLSKDGVGHVQAGAGIVIDSEPEAEYYESLKKAEALLKAVELSEAKQKMSRV